MEEEKPLNIEQVEKHISELTLAITHVITSRPKSKEMSAAACAALANVLVIVTTKLVGQEQAMDVVALAVSRGFQIINECREEMIKEGKLIS